MAFLWLDNATIASWSAALARIEGKLNAIALTTSKTGKDMAALDDAIKALETQVQANTDAEASAVALLGELASMIQANATDPAAVTDLATKLKASADALGAAIVANTPAG